MADIPLFSCRAGCGACCIAPSIARPFYGMPQGKAAGEHCVHLDEDYACELFGDTRRPDLCGAFTPEPAVCGDSREEALSIIAQMESASAPASEGLSP